MHLSADPTSPTYWGHCLSRPPLIFLDGVEQHDCVEADSGKGYVVRAARGDDGMFLVDGESLRLERIAGHVEIILPPSTDAERPGGGSKSRNRWGLHRMGPSFAPRSKSKIKVEATPKG